jgi:hypothetical protein
MQKRIIVSVVCLCLLFGATVARGQFGFGITVFDPSVYAEAITEVTKLVQQYNQLVQTYQMITNQYNQMLWMAKALPGESGALSGRSDAVVSVISHQYIWHDGGLDHSDQHWLECPRRIPKRD